MRTIWFGFLLAIVLGSTASAVQFTKDGPMLNYSDFLVLGCESTSGILHAELFFKTKQGLNIQYQPKTRPTGALITTEPGDWYALTCTRKDGDPLQVPLPGLKNIQFKGETPNCQTMTKGRCEIVLNRAQNPEITFSLAGNNTQFSTENEIAFAEWAINVPGTNRMEFRGFERTATYLPDDFPTKATLAFSKQETLRVKLLSGERQTEVTIGPIRGLFFQQINRLSCHGQTLYYNGKATRKSVAPTASGSANANCVVEKTKDSRIQFLQHAVTASIIAPGVQYAFCPEPKEGQVGGCEQTVEAKAVLGQENVLAAIDFLLGNGQFARVPLDAALAQASPTVGPKNGVVAVEEAIRGFIGQIFGEPQAA